MDFDFESVIPVAPQTLQLLRERGFIEPTPLDLDAEFSADKVVDFNYGISPEDQQHYNGILADHHKDAFPEAHSYDWVGDITRNARKKKLDPEDAIHTVLTNSFTSPKPNKSSFGINNWHSNVASSLQGLEKETRGREVPLSYGSSKHREEFDPLSVVSSNRRLGMVTGSSVGDQGSDEERIYQKLQRHPYATFGMIMASLKGLTTDRARAAIQKLKADNRIDPEFNEKNWLRNVMGNGGFNNVSLQDQVLHYHTKNPTHPFNTMRDRIQNRTRGYSSRDIKEAARQLQAQGKLPEEFQISRDYNFLKAKPKVAPGEKPDWKSLMRETIQKSTNINPTELRETYKKAGLDRKTYRNILYELQREGILPDSLQQKRKRYGHLPVEEQIKSFLKDDPSMGFRQLYNSHRNHTLRANKKPLGSKELQEVLTKMRDGQINLPTLPSYDSRFGSFDINDTTDPAPSFPQESFAKEDPDTGLTLHGFTGKVLDPKTNTLKHYIQGEQVPSTDYEDSLLNDPDINPTTEEGWSHEGTPLALGEDATHIKGEMPEDETSKKGSDVSEPPTEDTRETSPHEASYDISDQVGILHGDNTDIEEHPKPIPVGETEHILGAEGELAEADPDKEKMRQESLKFVQKTAGTTLGKFSEAGKAAIKQNAPNVAFFSSPAKLTEELAKLSPEVAENMSKGILYHGAYLPESKRLLLDGGNEKNTTEEIHAYEMSRAMADGREDSPEWKEAVGKDFKDEALTVYASDPRRAWGEFGRLAIGKGVGTDALRQKYPTATAVWEGYGLLPNSGKGEMVQLPEIFKPDAALFDDPKAEADSAYSLKEAGIATYARMGRGSFQWLKDNSEIVGDWAKGILSKTPPGLRMAVTGAMKRIYFTYYMANNTVRELAKSRGIPEDKAKWLASTLTGADFMFGTSKIIPMVTAAGAMGAGASPLVATGAAIAANFLPVGSLAYIALASGGERSAIDVWKKASKRVKSIVGKRKEAGAEFSDFEKEDLLRVITAHISASNTTDHHLWLACFLSAMDETEGNVRISCEIADEAAGDDEGNSPNPSPESPTDFGWEPESKGQFTWEDIKNEWPETYNEDDEGVKDAADYLMYNRPEHKDSWGDDYEFTLKAVNPRNIDYARHGPQDRRVVRAVNGYKDCSVFDPTMPPPVLIERHGVYQVADGHHRSEAAHHEGINHLWSYVAKSPHSNTPYGDGTKAPFHKAQLIEEKKPTDFGKEDESTIVRKPEDNYHREVGPSASAPNKKSTEAAALSSTAWHSTIKAISKSQPSPKLAHTHSNSIALSLATRAMKNSREGSHKQANLDHSILFRLHRERGHPEAEQHHWNAMLANEKAHNETKDFEQSSKDFDVYDLDKEFSVVDFTKSKVQVVVDVLKSDFREPDKGRKLKSTIKEGLEEGSQSVVNRFYKTKSSSSSKGEVPKEVESLRKKFIQKQLTYLANYIDGVYKGNIAIDPNRSAMYANSLKTFQAEILQFKAQQKGAKWERRLLGKGDSSCPACVKLWHKRWVKFGTLPKIGDTTCKVNCNCRFEYSYNDKKPN